MDLTIYDIIRRPIVTGKAHRLNSELQQLVIEVHMHANKPLVREALFKLFAVKVKNVRIVIRKGKNRFAGRKLVTTGRHTKRAIVTLQKGYTIDAFGGESNSMVQSAQAGSQE